MRWLRNKINTLRVMNRGSKFKLGDAFFDKKGNVIAVAKIELYSDYFYYRMGSSDGDDWAEDSLLKLERVKFDET